MPSRGTWLCSHKHKRHVLYSSEVYWAIQAVPKYWETHSSKNTQIVWEEKKSVSKTQKFGTQCRNLKVWRLKIKGESNNLSGCFKRSCLSIWTPTECFLSLRSQKTPFFQGRKQGLNWGRRKKKRRGERGGGWFSVELVLATCSVRKSENPA